MTKPIIAVPIGDPAGVGPEITAKALASEEVQACANVIVVGDGKIVRQAIEISKVPLTVKIISAVKEADFTPGVLNLIDLNNIDMSKFAFGKVSGMCGKLMCCLKYENEYYAETLKLMPKHGARVKTADGVGRVDDIDVLRRRIRVAIENEDGVTKAYYGIGDFEVLAQGGKQHSRAEEREEDDSAPDDADTVE